MGSPIAGIHNLRPEQELEKHTEHPRDHDQFPSARTHPQEHRLRLSLDSPQHVIREHNKTHQRRDLVNVPTMAFADGGCFFCRAVIREVKSDQSDRYVQDVVAQDGPDRQRDSPPRPVRLHRQLENRQNQAEKYGVWSKNSICLNPIMVAG